MRLFFVFIFITTGSFILNAQRSFAFANGFIQNKGQILDQNNETNNSVLFLFAGKGLKIQLRKSGYSYELFYVKDVPAVKPGKKFFENPEDLEKTKIIDSRVDIDFVNMNAEVEVVAEEPKTETLNYITCGKEIYGVNLFKKVTYKNVYSNIDIEFTLTGNDLTPLKYNIILHPGADINQIKFLCKGANSIRLEGNNLKIGTPLGEVTEQIPSSYYSDLPQQYQPVNFKLEKNCISFSCQYDKTRTLVIDPSSNIIWGTYFGGSQIEFCSATGIDSQNNVYIMGHTISNSNIATLGVYQSTIGGNFDLYLTKFNSNGALLWSTYFGGSNYETGYAIFVEPAGNIYVSGNSGSTVNVASPGAHQTVYGGGIDDAILAKFDPTGQRLWSTYYGGNMHDIAMCIAVDGSGNVIIGGHTESANTGNCIATPGAFMTAFSFNVDSYVAKFNTNGVRQWGSYFGDTGYEEAWGAAADASNNVIITGWTSSIAGIATPTCHQPGNGGNNDAYIAKFDPTGANLIWATYYGGTGDEQGVAVEVNAGLIYITGNAGSANNIATPGTYQIASGSAEDVFITCLNLSGVRQWATYYGGNGTDYVSDILLDANKNIFICGETLSTNSISTVGAYQPNIGLINTYDAYFAKFSNNGLKLKLASYYGDAGADNGKGIALDNTGKLYIAGETTSTVNITTPASYMPNAGGGGDAFLAKFCLAPEPAITPTLTTICINQNFSLSATPGFSSYAWNIPVFTSTLSQTGPFAPGNYYYIVTVYDAFGCSGTSDSVKIIVNNCLVGINETTANSEPKIFPNPANETIFIENLDEGKNSSVEIFSSAGQLILITELKTLEKKIDIKNLNPGLYFLKLIGLESSFVKKFIKQ